MGVVEVTWVPAFGDLCATHVVLAKASIQRLCTRGSRFAIQLFTPILTFPLRGKGLSHALPNGYAKVSLKRSQAADC